MIRTIRDIRCRRLRESDERQVRPNPDDWKGDDLFVKGDDYEKVRDLENDLKNQPQRPLGEGAALVVDFPAWAVEYATSPAPGMVSRLERDQIEGWKRAVDAAGYDVGRIRFGQDEYDSLEPQFGCPCMCVEAEIPPKRAARLGESEYDGQIWG